MSTKAILGLVVALVVIVGLGIWIFTDSNSIVTNIGPDNAGTVVVSFSDAAANLENINEVNMDVDKVEIFSETQGWVEVSSDDVEYKLLELRDSRQSMVYAMVDVEADNYTRVRVQLDGVTVVKSTGESAEASLPGTIMDVETVIAVEEGSTSSIDIDVMADQSLHVTSDGEFVFAPVIVVESRSNVDIDISNGGIVTITQGQLISSTSAGMNIRGVMETNFKLDSNIDLDVEPAGNIKIIEEGAFDAKL